MGWKQEESDVSDGQRKTFQVKEKGRWIKQQEDDDGRKERNWKVQDLFKSN